MIGYGFQAGDAEGVLATPVRLDGVVLIRAGVVTLDRSGWNYLFDVRLAPIESRELGSELLALGVD